jgi:hypothetical protein
MENERFEFQILANAVEMAASSSKMPQIARKMDRGGNPKKTKREKKRFPKQFRTLYHTFGNNNIGHYARP